MKLRLRRHETRETLKLRIAGTATLRDLRRRINASDPTSVHLSLLRKDSLLSTSPNDTLQSLGVASGDLIYYSLDPSPFIPRVHEIRSVSPAQEHRALNHSGPAHRSTVKGTEPMRDVKVAAPAGSKRLSELFFLKKMLLEKCDEDFSESTILAMSVHAIMLESGFVLFDHGSDKSMSSKEIRSVSLRYTLPPLIIPKGTNLMESVTVTFQRIGRVVVAYGTLGGSSRTHRVSLVKKRFVPVIDLVVDTLKFEKQASSIHYREVFVLWRMVKDGLVNPLMFDLCDKAGLEVPPCLMNLPTDMKLKILEYLPGESLAKMACVCTEMRHLSSDSDLWKQKFLKEGEDGAVNQSEPGGSGDWKEKFASLWRQKKIFKGYSLMGRNRKSFIGYHPHGCLGFHGPGLATRRQARLQTPLPRRYCLTGVRY